MSVCPTLCPTGLNRACRWLQVEDGGPDWGIPHVDRKNSAQAALGFTRHAVRVRLGPTFFDHRPRVDQRELTTIRLTGLNDRDHVWLVR